MLREFIISKLLFLAVALMAQQPNFVTVGASFQSELGCPGDWDPACVFSHLTFDVNDQV